MYLVIEPEFVGTVENGVITGTYPIGTQISSILSNDASPVKSEVVGERVSSTSLVKAVQNFGRVVLSQPHHQIRIEVDPSATIASIRTKLELPA